MDVVLGFLEALIKYIFYDKSLHLDNFRKFREKLSNTLVVICMQVLFTLELLLPFMH